MSKMRKRRKRRKLSKLLKELKPVKKRLPIAPPTKIIKHKKTYNRKKQGKVNDKDFI